jgi:ribosomal protein S18 acetylase RimI-like enzyme
MDIRITFQTRVPKMTPEYRNRVEEIIFKAHKGPEMVGHLVVDTFVERNTDELNDAFFSDLETGLPRPYVFYVGVEDGFQKQGIGSRLALFAAEHYKTAGFQLHTGTINSDPAIALWESLARKKLAEEISYENKRRWKLIPS